MMMKTLKSETSTHHGQEDPELSVEGHDISVGENKLRFVHFLALEDDSNLLSSYGKHRELDPIELIKAPPRPRLSQTYITTSLYQPDAFVRGQIPL